MAESKQTESGLVRALRGGLGLKLAGAAMVLALVAIVAVALIMFVGGFTPTATVTVDAPRSGLVLDPDAKVKVRGVEIGRVASVDHTDEGARLKLDLDPDLLRLVPSNADVDIRSTTVFGAKYVNFVVPQQPSSTPLLPGATLTAQRVTVEFNTLFQHLSDVLAKIEPEKLNATLSALGTALQGRGQKLGDLLVQSDAYLRDINPYLPTLQQDLAKTGEVTGLYADTVNDLLRTVDNFTVTSQTLAQEQDSLDNVLVNLTGLADTTGAVLRENENQLGTALDLLRPTTGLLEEYAPALYCLIGGLGKALPLGEAVFGGLQEGVALNTGFMYGAKPYTYPEDLPKVNATGGPQCAGLLDREPGSHADYVVTDTSEGHVYTPSTTLTVNPPKIFQILFAGLPGVPRP
ncbi:MCE family protein [Nocardia abscessus]|uniref:MCE family protein n=1 Tax=Nocardia abscessus TaxID=120957 RepID=A0ABS0C4T7_9NOCA|nr:MCE family protein [Nocardia abscessus]MBF6224597.1 MCE family protein [Nocardia abscessus]